MENVGLRWGAVPAGVLAGLLGVAAVLSWGQPFRIPAELADLPATAAQEKLDAKDRATRKVECLNSTVSVALLSAIIAVVLTGCASRREKRSAASVAAGVLAAALCGAVGGGAGQLLLDALRPVPVSTLSLMTKTILAHLVVWISGGLGVGVAVGIVKRKSCGVARPSLAGALGGAVAAILYSPAGALAFPLNQTDRIVPTGTGNALLWGALTAGVMATVLVGLCSTPRRSVQPTT